MTAVEEYEVADLQARLPERTMNAYEALRCLVDAGLRGLTDAELADTMRVDYPAAAIARKKLSEEGWLEWTGQIRGRGISTGQVRRIRDVGARAWAQAHGVPPRTLT